MSDDWHIRRILDAAERATPRPDLDEAEWQGEVEPAFHELMTIVVTVDGTRLCKAVRLDAEGQPMVEDYGNAKLFKVAQRWVPDLDAMSRIIGTLARKPNAAVIRAEPKAGVDLSHCRRLLYDHTDDDGVVTAAAFAPCDRSWLAIDLDGIPEPTDFDWRQDGRATFRYLVEHLPEPFARAGGIVQATGSAGFKPGCRARLWFKLDRPITKDEGDRWLADYPVDRCLLRPVQLNFTADPILGEGVADPMGWRLVEVPGPVVEVAGIPEPPPPPKIEPRRPAVGRGRYLEAIIAGEARRVADAKEGARNDNLYIAAKVLGRLVGGGELTVAEITAELTVPAMAKGLTIREIERSIASGLRAGIGDPRRLGE